MHISSARSESPQDITDYMSVNVCACVCACVCVCTARITVLSSRLAAGVVNFDSADDVVISAAVAGAPVSSTRAVLRVVRGPGVYGIVNVPFQVAIQGSSSTDAVIRVTPSSGVVTFLDRQVSNIKHK